MPIARAEVATENASRYLQQLCKHWAHKRPVTSDATAGEVAFEGGRARFRAQGGRLCLEVEAPEQARLERLEIVVAEHLARFAHKEALTVDWTREVAAVPVEALTTANDV